MWQLSIDIQKKEEQKSATQLADVCGIWTTWPKNLPGLAAQPANVRAGCLSYGPGHNVNI